MSAIRYRPASTGLSGPVRVGGGPARAVRMARMREGKKERVTGARAEAYKSLPAAAYGDEVGDRRFEPVRVASSQPRKG